MGQNYATVRRDGAVQPSQFFHQIGVGQAVETVPLNALCLEGAWNWQDSGNTRHIAMKGGVKARDLRQIGITLAEHFH
jgi:hypothetical protein